MATAIVQCKCATCGKDFEIRKKCCNRADAEGFEKYAVAHYDECKECYKKRIREEREEIGAELAAKMTLPEITGKSEKQIGYAYSMRNQALARLTNYPRSYKFVCAYIADKEKTKSIIKKIADERYGGNLREAIAGEYSSEALALIEIRHESDAGRILDTLLDK